VFNHIQTKEDKTNHAGKVYKLTHKIVKVNNNYNKKINKLLKTLFNWLIDFIWYRNSIEESIVLFQGSLVRLEAQWAGVFQSAFEEKLYFWVSEHSTFCNGRTKEWLQNQR